MTLKVGKYTFLFLAVFFLLLGSAGSVLASGETNNDYTKIPPFIEVGENPNLLLLIDNSASMYDLAYHPEDLDYCYGGPGEYEDAAHNIHTFDPFDPTKDYGGYSLNDRWYYYWGPPHSDYENANKFNSWNFNQSSYPEICTDITDGTLYRTDGLCIWVDESGTEPVVKMVLAKGRFLNWLASSKFDVEKKVLTGGKVVDGLLTMETRGCEGKRFVKEVQVEGPSGATFYATFGVRQTSGGDPTTQIDIFRPSDQGFNFSACLDAIDYWTDPDAVLGQLMTKTTACLTDSDLAPALTPEKTALNHILQECWFYKSHGDWQSGEGTVTTLRNDCARVYNATPGEAPPATGYNPPEDQDPHKVCYGQYYGNHADGGPWGIGYVGQCWEPHSDAGYTYQDRPCDPSIDPTTTATNPYCDATTSLWMYCDGNYVSASGGSCHGSPGTWEVVQDAILNSGSTITSVDWTDDADANITFSADGGYDCVDQALKKYCSDIDDQTVVDATEVSDPYGYSWGIPAILIDSAVETQLDEPLMTMNGKIDNTIDASQPFQARGLIQEFKFNLRMGAMQFNPGAVSECAAVEVLNPDDGTFVRYRASLYDCLEDTGVAINASSLPDTTQLDGGQIISYIDDGIAHNVALVNAINGIVANAWTPIAEAYYEAVGYYTQRNALRLNDDDFICDQDYSTYASSFPAWVPNHPYPPGSRVHFDWDYDSNMIVDETKMYFTVTGGTSTPGAATIKDDKGVKWTPLDPVLAGCQKNNILIITDGGSTADLNSAMTGFVTGGNNDGDAAPTYNDTILEASTGGNYTCQASDGSDSLFGSTLLDDLSYYAYNETDYPDIFSYPTVSDVDKQKITTWVVSAGSLKDDGTDHDCNPTHLLQQTAANSDQTLIVSDLSEMENNLRDVFNAISSEASSGSAASVISNSRTGEGAIFQAVFYPSQEDQHGRKLTWSGDVHAMWLDELGNIREDCGSGGCSDGNQDTRLDRTEDNILQFYSDENNVSHAMSFSDSDGNGKYDPSTDLIDDDINLRDIPYLWSAGDWLAEVAQEEDDSTNNVATQRTYSSTAKARYIITSVDGSNMIPFTPGAVSAALGNTAYQGYFHASTVDEANDIISYIRGDDTRFFPDGTTPRNYRPRLIDWHRNGTPVIWKLGDVVDSTPTVVAEPAEDYDLIYRDQSYLAFRKRYRNRRSMVYAGGNDGGLHAFNAGYYNRETSHIDKAPPVDTDNNTKVEYDLGAEMWMFVPKNLFPHLKWLTQRNYTHVNYVDMKPYVFDAKIFHPDTDHPQGWGTILVGGLGYGGGDIGVDTDGDGVDNLTLRSEYFILDITNPEVPPRLLGEFNDPNLGFTTGAPTAIPMLMCDLNVNCPDDMPMDWYLAVPSGPYDSSLPLTALDGRSDQSARLYTMPLGGTGGDSNLSPFTFGSSSPIGSTHVTYNVADSDTDFPNSYFSGVIAVDYDLDFKTDALYFGSVANTNTEETDQNTGGMHRLVIGEDDNPLNWTLNTFFKTPGNQPVTATPAVASDGTRIWVYFGTGRYETARLDKENRVQQSYYGIKEYYDTNGDMDNSYSYSDQGTNNTNGANLIDTSDVWVEDGGPLHGTLKAVNTISGTETTISSVDTFAELDTEISKQDNSDMDIYNGWKLDFDVEGERNIGQAAILGNIVTFTGFVPAEDPCVPSGDSYLWAPYFRTGTAYYRNVIGTTVNGTTDTGDDRYQIDIHGDRIIGEIKEPNLQVTPDGTKAFVQTSTGAIISIQQKNPGVVNSGEMSWRSGCGE